MFVSKRQEWRIQRWDGKCWRQGVARSEEEVGKKLREMHIARPNETFRIICITTTIEAACPVGPPVPLDADFPATV